MKMEEWKECTLSDLGTIVGGATPSTKDSSNYENGSIAWITPKDLSNHTERFISHGERNITEKGLKSCSALLMPPNSILFTSRAPIGYIAIAKNEVCTNQGFKSIVPNKDTDFMFLYYLLRYNKDNIENLGSGTTFKEVSGSTMRNVPVKVPPLPTQQKIAAILSSLDDKIELNNKINTNLEQQAQALFKNWFVDFEPFGGKMPEGWKVGTVSEIIVLHDSKRIPLSSQQREKMKKKYPYYGATSLMDYVDNYLFDGIFLLLGEDGTVIDSEGFPILQYVEGKFWVNNHAHILTGKNGFSVEMLYLLFSLTNVKDKVTGAVQQKISQGNLNSITTIIPPEEVCKKFDLLIQPLFSQIRNLKQENERLSVLRDTLLPKLMNGEIGV